MESALNKSMKSFISILINFKLIKVVMYPFPDTHICPKNRHGGFKKVLF